MKPIETLDLDWIEDVLPLLLPELVLCGLIVLLIVFNLVKSLNRFAFHATIVGLIFHLLLSGWLQWVTSAVTTLVRNVLDSTTPLDTYGFPFKIIFSLSALITTLISGKNHRVEYYIFIISLLLGACLLTSADNFIMILLSMELISISSYMLTSGTTANKQRAEAAWKFFIYGSVATAVMIFGMSYLYGATGNLSFETSKQLTPLATIGGIMMLGGLFFKMTAAPFHLWAPDVYESAPAPIVAYLSVVPKLAALVVVAQWTHHSDYWIIILAAFALFTIVVGTLSALNQTNSKRMMAYSSVAQAGFLLIIPATSGSSSLMIFYALVFAIMNYVVFIVIYEQEKSGKGVSFSDFHGIGYTNPFIAVVITLGLVSLTGLPPMAGFMAKLFVFSAAWSQYSNTGNLIFLSLFVIGLLATAASLFFYLKIPFYAFFRRSEEVHPIKISRFTNLLLIILVALLLIFFLAPGLVDRLSY